MSAMPPLGQMCDGMQGLTPSDRIRNILNNKARIAKIYDQFCTTVIKSDPEEGENSPLKNDRIASDTGSNEFPEKSQQHDTQVDMCCDCAAPTGLRPCVTPPDTDCPFLETESVCFFKNLPPLTFAPYTQCKSCGKRFDDTDFEEHVSICCKRYRLPPTPIEERKEILPTRCDPMYKPPFILKDLKPSCVDLCLCIEKEAC